MRTLLTAALLALALTTPPATAQDQQETLADIRQQLTVLFVEVQRLKRELSTTGGVATPTVSGSTTERVDLIEAELQRLTSKTEELELRINRIVSDGTNRIGDLEFRLVELEGGDISALGETTTLGGDTGAVPVAPAVPSNDGAQLAMGEQADYDRAKAALDAGDFQGAADQFLAFSQTYTVGPLTGAAHYHRGEALSGMGDTTNAARAFLESYSGSPDSPFAADALFKLGESLGTLGQLNEACVTLGQVSILYPGANVVGPSQQAMARFNCG